MTSPLPLVLTIEPSASMRSKHPSLDTVVLYGVVGLLLFGPLAFGAVEPWSVSMVQVGASLLFVLWAVGQLIRGELEIAGNSLFLPMSLLGALILFQLVTGRTAYRAGTFSAALLYCTYAILCFLVVQCLRKNKQIRVLAWLCSGYGFAVSMFALIQGIAPNGKLYWLRTAESGGWIYGPYVNHNHYAGLMEVLAPIPLVISLSSDVRVSRRALAAVAAAIMTSTIFLSGSRGGMAAFVAQVGLLIGLLIKRRKRWKVAFALGPFLAISFGLLAWLGGGELAERVASIHSGTRTEASAGTRLTIDRDALKIFAEKPLLGWGLGVFPEIYPQFGSLSTNLQVGAAHNDYLQLLVEMGALGFATVLWFLLTLFRRTLKKLNHWPADSNTALTLAAFLGVVGILVHSFVDFNLQIPANAALFYVLCIVCVMEPRFDRHHRRHQTIGLPENECVCAANDLPLDFATRKL